MKWVINPWTTFGTQPASNYVESKFSSMKWKWLVIGALIVSAGAAVTILLVPRVSQWRPGLVTIQGAVVRSDEDPRRELPISGVTVTAWDGTSSSITQSDSSGYFHLTFREKVWPSEEVTLSFRSPDYKPLDLKLLIGARAKNKKLYVAALDPVAASLTPTGSTKPLTQVSNIRIRYTVNTSVQRNIATAVKTFEIVNQGNVPCQQHNPCSPDGQWKAATASTTLDAGANNVFRNVRASCFAGPCPFTRIDTGGFSQGGRRITASALDWSDTASFLVEAEVFHNSNESSVRESYPVIFGRVMHFTLPADQEGLSFEAEINGTPMVFPLGPDLYTSWASCNSRPGTEGQNSITFQCELKPGFRF